MLMSSRRGDGALGRAVRTSQVVSVPPLPSSMGMRSHPTGMALGGGGASAGTAMFGRWCAVAS